MKKITLVKTSNPSQGFPFFFGGTHYLYKVDVPPPQETVHDDQSLITIQYPSLESPLDGNSFPKGSKGFRPLLFKFILLRSPKGVSIIAEAVNGSGLYNLKNYSFAI